MEWLSWLIFATALGAAAVNIFYLLTNPGGAKWWLRFVNAIALIMFSLIYLLLGINFFEQSQPPPILVRPGAILLLLLLTAETLFDLLRRR